MLISLCSGAYVGGMSGLRISENFIPPPLTTLLHKLFSSRVPIDKTVRLLQKKDEMRVIFKRLLSTGHIKETSQLYKKYRFMLVNNGLNNTTKSLGNNNLNRMLKKSKKHLKKKNCL